MINLLAEKIQLVVSKLKLSSLPDVDDMNNIKEGLNLIGDYSVLLHGYLNCLNMELEKYVTENNNKEK